MCQNHRQQEPPCQTQDEKYRVLPYPETLRRRGVLRTPTRSRAAGIDVGTPIVYPAARFFQLAGDRIAGTSVDDRAGCAVMVEAARAPEGGAQPADRPLVFSVQEEFNLRGALPAAQALLPDIAIQLDLILATDTPRHDGARRRVAGRRTGR